MIFICVLRVQARDKHKLVKTQRDTLTLCRMNKSILLLYARELESKEHQTN